MGLTSDWSTTWHGCAKHHPYLEPCDGWASERTVPGDIDPQRTSTPMPPFGQEQDPPAGWARLVGLTGASTACRWPQVTACRKAAAVRSQVEPPPTVSCHGNRSTDGDSQA